MLDVFFVARDDTTVKTLYRLELKETDAIELRQQLIDGNRNWVRSTIEIETDADSEALSIILYPHLRRALESYYLNLKEARGGKQEKSS